MSQKLIRIDRRTCVWIALLTLIIAGVRFNDGTMLLAIAEGHGVDDAAFFFRESEFIWDSPLKVVLLRLAPPNIMGIAFAAAGLAALPLLGLLARESSMGFYLTAVLIAVTPALKISFQNAGVGDGLVYVLILVAVATRSGFGVFLSFLLLGLWHPHQAFFIGGTYFLYSSIYEAGGWRHRAAWAMFALLIAFVAFILFRMTLDFDHYTRVEYLADRMYELPVRNIRVLPVSGFYIAFWVYVVRRMLPDVRLPLYAIAWSVLLVAVTTFTTDVTRVLSIIGLPALMIPMKRLYLDLGRVDPERWLRLPWTWVVVSILIPAYAWRGFDVFLWSELLDDLCRYGVVCLTESR